MSRPAVLGFFGLMNKEIRRFGKVAVQTVVTPFVTSFLYLLIFGVSLGASIKLSSGLSYLSFLIPGLVMMSVLNNCYQNSSSSIISGKFSGDLEDLRRVPLTSNQIVWALSFGGLVRGILVGCITFFVGLLFIKNIDGAWLGIQHPGVLLYFILIGGLSFAQLGISVAFWAKTFDQASAFGAFVLLPLTYLGGVFFSIENLHPFWQTLSKFNPLLYLINGVRFGILGVSDVSVSVAAIVAFIGLVFFYCLARVAMRTGSFNRW